MTARQYRGPLPHPELLEGYERAVPGSAETILNQFVAEGRHRHGIENRIVDSNIKHEGRSQFLGAGLSALGIIASVVMALYDQPVVAAITFVVNFGSLVTIYFVGSRVTEPEPPTPPSTPAPPAESQDQ